MEIPIMSQELIIDVDEMFLEMQIQCFGIGKDS